MTDKKVTRLIFGLITLALVLWIFLNPWANVKALERNPRILIDVNNFFSYMGFGYRLVLKDICAIVRFTEYLVFGIITIITTKVCSKNIFKSITIPLFMGLFVSVFEVYYRSLGNLNIGVNEIIISFVEFCIGMIFYIIFTGIKPSKRAGFKYRSLKYDGRR